MDYKPPYTPVNRQSLMAGYNHADTLRAMSMGDRIAARMRKLGMSQSELARRVGVEQPTIHMLIKGKSRTSGKLHRIAQELGTTVDWLEGEIEDESAAATPARDFNALAEKLGLALVKELEIGYSMGGGAVMDDYTVTGLRAFESDFLSRIAKGPASALFVARGDGDSMQPTLWHDDSVLIDTSQRQITQQDRIWALSYGDLGMIKRVRRLPSGRFLILSDNPTVAPFEAADDEVHVIGRVVWIGRRI
jgi:phage repressor protein C with HTH and peptisase S24 domain